MFQLKTFLVLFYVSRILFYYFFPLKNVIDPNFVNEDVRFLEFMDYAAASVGLVFLAAASKDGITVNFEKLKKLLLVMPLLLLFFVVGYAFLNGTDLIVLLLAHSFYFVYSAILSVYIIFSFVKHFNSLSYYLFIIIIGLFVGVSIKLFGESAILFETLKTGPFLLMSFFIRRKE